MTSTRAWDRAAVVPARTAGDRRRTELAALPPDRLPDVAELFTFMRDAEHRFETLRLRIEERAQAAGGERRSVIETVIQHPGLARVLTTTPRDGAAVGSYDLWISDGETVRTYAADHRLGTRRPARHRLVGLHDRDLPAFSKVYEPRTALPMETLPETFVHPAGYCQNVLATGRLAVTGTDEIAGREAILVTCDHPRAIELQADRPDFRIELGVDRDSGLIARLVESVDGLVTRHAEATVIQPDAPLPPSTFAFEFPAGTTFVY